MIPRELTSDFENGADGLPLWLYPVVAAVFILIIAGTLQHAGTAFRNGASAAPIVTGGSTSVARLDTPRQIGRSHAVGAVAQISLQIVVVLLVGHCLRTLARRVRQPTVIAEVTTGIVLGPSVLGGHWPAATAWLFPRNSMDALQLFSQMGVILYMFKIGLDVDWTRIRRQVHGAVVVSHISILVPFLLGVLLAVPLFSAHRPQGVDFIPFALFVGVALSITAFPVLARILGERGMSATPLGSLALTCAAVDDVTAWSLLAVVVAIVSGDGGGRILATLAALALVTAAMIVVVRPLLTRLLSVPADSRLRLDAGGVTIAIVVLFTSVLAMEVIGVHAVFGAFLAGVIMPAGPGIRSILHERLEGVTSLVLLPLFFAYTGLRTEIRLLDTVAWWLTLGGVVVVATIGKLGGSAVAARLVGINWNGALILGALMNTRGLMELIALSVAYDLGIISGDLFTCFTLMALITTAMTGPLIDIVSGQPARAGLGLTARSAAARPPVA